MNYSEDINSEITDGKDLSNYQEEVKNRILRTREVDKYDLMTLGIMSEYLAKKILKNIKPVSYDRNTFPLEDVRGEISCLLESKKLIQRNKNKLRYFYEITDDSNVIKVNFLQKLSPTEKSAAIKSRLEDMKTERTKRHKENYQLIHK